MHALQLFVLLLLQVSLQASAQTVWAVFGFNVHGDSTPALLRQPRTLTPLGAKNVYNAGGKFRGRYILGGTADASRGTWVKGLNQHKLDSEQVRIYTTSDQFNEASTLAFMQGFYPPLGTVNQSYTYIDDTYLLSNGSIVGAPLNDYQYPRIYAAGLADPTSILVAGQADCDKYQELEEKYQSSSEFQKIESDNAQFYSNLYNTALEGVLSRSMASYAEATEIFQYLQYGYLHNKSLESAVSPSDFHRARVLANQYAFATNGNLTSSDTGEGEWIRAIAGRTLARLILQSLETNIQTEGFASKMTLAFGSMEAVVAFASLSQLASSMNSEFYGMPNPGASMILELFSMNATSSDTGYPQISDLYVRFLFRNGSYTNEAFTEYPLFGYSPSHIDIPFTEFAARLSTFLLPSTESWCDTCSSSPMFCLGAANIGKRYTKERLSLAGAGAIGAAVTLAVVAIATAIAWLCGLGLYRRRRAASLGGFKGNNKMASDQDVSFANSKNGIFHKITDPGCEGTTAKNHERTGSWEMRNKNQTSADGALRLDDEGDIADISANSEPVKCHQIV
jgi:Histidine phosphatase superfamily (branch 2)